MTLRATCYLNRECQSFKVPVFGLDQVLPDVIVSNTPHVSSTKNLKPKGYALGQRNTGKSLNQEDPHSHGSVYAHAQALLSQRLRGGGTLA